MKARDLVKRRAVSPALDDDIPSSFAGEGDRGKMFLARNIKIMTAADFGVTRRQMYEAIRLAEVPDDEFERIMALPHRGKISAVRYIKSGRWRRGVADNDAHIRLPRQLFDALARHAKAQEKSVSDLVVELIDIALGRLLDESDEAAPGTTYLAGALGNRLVHGSPGAAPVVRTVCGKVTESPAPSTSRRLALAVAWKGGRCFAELPEER